MANNAIKRLDHFLAGYQLIPRKNILRPIRILLVDHCLGLLFEIKGEFPGLSSKKPHR